MFSFEDFFFVQVTDWLLNGILIILYNNTKYKCVLKSAMRDKLPNYNYYLM